ncbi:molybdopterin-dependent oxidoreductase [Streptomyces sp. NPDC020362]|uniref:molybdopterin-dependent oxidoreductase n=1 Tax=unclassified Streptomyces TaxID=2593676 RepID=UPI00340CE802
MNRMFSSPEITKTHSTPSARRQRTYRPSTPPRCRSPAWRAGPVDDQQWSGPRLDRLAALADMSDAGSVLVESIQPPGPFTRVVLRGNRIRDPRALLALRVNGGDLSLDHGYPARIIVPANPGVNNTKWVHRLTFRVCPWHDSSAGTARAHCIFWS